MRFDIEIPDEIVKILHQKHGRKKLVQKFGISEYKAQYYCAAYTALQSSRPIIILADTHIPYHNHDVYDLVLSYIQTLNPKMLILLGDFADFYKVSHWLTDPNRMSFRQELQCVRYELRRIDSLFPNARKVFILGNHEERLLKHLWQKSPELSDLNCLTIPYLLQLDDCNFEFVDTVRRLEDGEKSFQVGGYALIHGH